MNKNIKPWITRIRKCDWFRKTGVGDLPGVLRAQSWKDVAKHLKSEAWDEMSLAALNEFHKACAKAGPFTDDFDELYDIVDVALEESLHPVVKKQKIPECVIDSLQGHVMCLLRGLCHFGADFQSFDRQIVELYLAGYCPCGYQGKYPRGQLIVY